MKLNELWESYILSLLPNRPNVCLSTYHDVLLRADYHGAKVKIIHSRSKTQIGIEGMSSKQCARSSKSPKDHLSSIVYEPIVRHCCSRDEKCISLGHR